MRRVVLLLVIAAFASVARGDESAAKRHYELAAADATTTLRQFAEQSGQEIIYVVTTVRGVTTNAVKGEFTAREALTRLVANTGLLPLEDAKTGAVSIIREARPESKSPRQSSPPNATKPETSPNTSNSMKKPSAIARKTTWIATLLAFAAGAEAGAQTSAAPTDAPVPVTLMEAFSVTGSNIRMNTSEADRGRLPIEFIPAEKFQFTSGERIGDFLRSEPYIAGAYLSAGNTNAGGWTSMSIHGVGRNYTLQLVDGRRISQEDTVSDISGIAAEAIESVDVLKGGASAIYGSSAVGGVLNLKLIKHFTGAETIFSYGNTTANDAGFKRAALIYGAKIDRLSLAGSVSFSSRAEVASQDRAPTNTSDFRAWGGLDRRLATSGDPMRIALASAPSAPLIIDLSRFQPGQTGKSAADYVPWNQQKNTIGTVPYTLISADRRGQGTWSAEYEIFGQRLVAFATGYFDNRQTRDRSTASVVTVTVPAANPYNPFGQAATVFYRFNGTELNPDKQNLVQDIWDTVALQGVFGFRGQLGRFNYEAALNNASLNRTQTIFNDVATQLAQAAANRTDATALNVFGYNANNAAQTAGLTPVHGYVFKNKLSMVDARLNGPLFDLPTGTVQLALGAEHRRSDYQRVSDFPWSTYTFGVSGNFQSTPHYLRSATAYFGEATVPVLKLRNEGSPIASAEINGALRRDDYSDFSGTTIHSFSLSTQGLNKNLVLRTVFSQGVRAPFETDLNAPNATSILSGLFDPVRKGVFPVTRITGGNPNLKPEKADTYDYGIIYTLPFLSGVTMKADYWSVDIKDRIFAPAPQDILNGIASGGSLSRDPVTGNVTIDGRSVNGTERSFTGYDFGLSYTLNTARLGRFGFNLSSTFITKAWDKSSGFVSELVDHYAGSLNLSGGGGGTEPIPRWASVLGTTWYFKQWNAGFKLHYNSGLHDIVVGLIDRRTESYSTGDVQVGYDFGKEEAGYYGLLRNLRVSVGADNVWNEGLPFVAATTTGWDQNLSDPRGRYLYVTVKKKL